MAITLPETWVDHMTASLQARELPAETTFVVTVQVAGTADGDVDKSWRVVDRWLVPADDAAEADLLIALSGKEALDVVEGKVPLPVGFMRGKVKISGDPRAALSLLRASVQTQQ